MQHYPARINHGCPHARSRRRVCRPLTAYQPPKKDTPCGKHQVPAEADQDEPRGDRAQQGVKCEFKTAIRKFREAAEAGNADEAKDALKVASTKLDKAVSKGVIHKNQAANKKSARWPRRPPVSEARHSATARGPSPLG